MSKSLFSVCSLILVTLISFAQAKADKQLINDLDQLINDRYKTVAPGCVILVAKKGKVIFEKAFGTANLELNVPMKTEMIFRIGSMTKQYTAIAILQLLEQGKISLEDSIQKFIRDFPPKGYTITIENLLTHTSGIIGYDVLDFKIPNTIRIDFDTKQIIDSLAKRPLEFAPSSRYNYSNSNYLLLGYIIEQVSGKTYEDYLRENIFNPVGLSNTFYESPTSVIRNRASGYAMEGADFQNAGFISMSQVFSAGALLSNVGDLFQWHQALYSYKLVKKETLERAFTPFRLSDGTLSEYGYGWFIKDWKGKKSIGHGGAIDGFRSMEVYFPEEDIYVTMLFNSDNNSFLNLTENVADLTIGKAQFKQGRNLKLSEQILNRYVGTYKNDKFNVTIKVYMENGVLYSDLSNGTGSHMEMVPQSETKFALTIKTPTTVEFVLENDKSTKLIATQKEKVEFIRIE